LKLFDDDFIGLGFCEVGDATTKVVFTELADDLIAVLGEVGEVAHG